MHRLNHRRTLRRVLLVLIVVALYLFVFVGSRQPIVGTPYTLVIQPGVSAQSVTVTRQGLTISNQFLTSNGLQSVSYPVDVRLAKWSPCTPLEPILALGSVGKAYGTIVCINTISGVWKQGLNENEGLALAAVAHEHYHLVQYQQGCGPALGSREFEWIIEGSATYIGWETVIHAGLLERAWVDELITQIIADDPTLGPLASYETSAKGAAVYSVSYHAIKRLVAAPNALTNLEQFCTQVGAGLDWRSSFEQAFGLPVAEFYTHFEASRPSGQQ